MDFLRAAPRPRIVSWFYEGTVRARINHLENDTTIERRRKKDQLPLGLFSSVMVSDAWHSRPRAAFHLFVRIIQCCLKRNM